jgi:hypothetical protein
MQTGKMGPETRRGRRHFVRALIFALMVVGLIGLSGCIWVPWGPCMGPGPGGGGRGGPQGGGAGGPAMQR